MKPLLSFALMLGAAVVLVSCDSSQAEDASQKKAVQDKTVSTDTSTQRRVVVNVETMIAQPETFNDVINVVGTVKPAEDIMVASEEGGKVARWFVQKGAYVSKGQTLLKLNDDLLRSQLAAAEAQYNIAKLTFDRSSQVFTEGGAVSEVSVTTAQYNVDAARANVELLKTRIAKTRITAPMSGRIDSRLTDVGEMVAPGAPVARLLQTGTVKVTAGVPERFVSGMKTGLPAEMTFDALGGRSLQGRVTYVGAAISDRDRTIPIEVEIPNSGNSYTPEMVATMRIVKDEFRGVIVVPRTAVVRVEDGYHIYVVLPRGKENIVEARPVQLGPADKGKIVVTAGLKPGERIITVGQAKVNPGEMVTY